MIKGDLVRHLEELRTAREPFVYATVVRAAAPTSVRPGDSALVLADGTIDGFVGGVCAQASVRLHAIRTMETGESLLLRLVPGEDAAAGGSAWPVPYWLVDTAFATMLMLLTATDAGLGDMTAGPGSASSFCGATSTQKRAR